MDDYQAELWREVVDKVSEIVDNLDPNLELAELVTEVDDVEPLNETEDEALSALFTAVFYLHEKRERQEH